MGVYLGEDKVANGGFIGNYDSLPVGSVLPFSSENPPTGYLLCDGSEVSRTLYEELFKVIGTSFGEGDGVTTFNLPNLKGRVPVGLSDVIDSKFNVALGTTLGEEEHKLTMDEIPNFKFSTAHVGYSDSIWSATNGTHTYGTGRGWTNQQDEAQRANINTGFYHDFSFGGGQEHNIIQPSLVVNYIIKVSGTAILTGNVVDSLEENSTTNAPSQRAVNELKPIILFNNPSGESVTIKLNDEAEKYEYLEIFYSLNGGNKHKSMKHCMDFGDTVVLDGQWCTGDGQIMQFQSAEFIIAGKNITQKHMRYVNSNTMGAPEQQTASYVKRVLGYK
jgi:microcystin-dependent protein